MPVNFVVPVNVVEPVNVVVPVKVVEPVNILVHTFDIVVPTVDIHSCSTG